MHVVDAVADCAIAVLDRQGRVVTWNSGADGIFGYRETEMVGRSFALLYPVDDVDSGKPDHDLANAAAQGSQEQAGWRVRSNGSAFWAHVILAVLNDAGHRAEGYALVVRDMTKGRPPVNRLEDRLHAVADVNRAGVAEGSTDDVLQLIACRARQLVGAAVTVVVTPEQTGDMVVRVADGDNAEALRGLRLPAASSAAGEVLRDGRARVVADLARERLAHHGPVAADEPEAALLVPMTVGSRVIGVIWSVNRRGGRSFDEEQLETLRMFAEQVAMTAEQAGVREHRPRPAAAAQGEDRALRQALDTLTQAVVDSTDIVACSIHLLDAEAGVRTAGSHGLSEELIRGMDAACRTRVRHPVLDAIASRGPVVVDDHREGLLDDARYHHVHPLLRRVEWGAMTCLPLLGQAEPQGAVCYYLDHHRRPSAVVDVAVHKVVAGVAAAAVGNARMLAADRESVVVEERQRLARELHDSVSQALYGIALGARTAQRLLSRDPGPIREPIEYVLELADSGLAEMRALILGLRPESLEMEGLAHALAQQAEAVHTSHGIAVETFLEDMPGASIDAQQALYRIGQEALHNSARHAEARHVEVRLTAAGTTVALDVIDDGIGFRPEDQFPGHLGLRSMRERALGVGGSFQVTSNPGSGTHVMARVPMAESVDP
jgi:PAS domain S-box-containing protein